MCARAVAVFCAAPLDLTRTLQQASSATTAKAGPGPSSTWQVLRSVAHGSGAPGLSAAHMRHALPLLWTGCGATLARDLVGACSGVPGWG